jgi:hypothetical protein
VKDRAVSNNAPASNDAAAASTPMRLEDRGGVKVAVTDLQLKPLSQDLVRATLERVRRRTLKVGA